MNEQLASGKPARAPLRDTYDLDKLPTSYQALLDPALSLPPEVTFFAAPTSPPKLIGTLAGVAVLLLCGVLAVLRNINANRGAAVPDNALIVVAVFCFIAARAAGLAARAVPPVAGQVGWRAGALRAVPHARCPAAAREYQLLLGAARGDQREPIGE